MGMLSTALKRCRGLKTESDGKALQDPARRARGRRLQEEARSEAAARRGRNPGPPPADGAAR
ncbi:MULTISPECIES: hypothetical protein [unclassified Streptomyces]|uniref:hypothetical protein n=1 Tax=unclassified Streptomyces TaxID=2593676 RepID=UPI0036FB9E99